MPAFSMAAPPSQPVRAISRKMEVQRAFEKKLEELEVEQDQLQQQIDRDEAKGMEILEQFLPLPDGLEQAVVTATQQRDYISAEWERYNNLLSRVQGAKDVVLSPEDEQLLEQALGFADGAEVLDGNTATGEESPSIGAAEAKEAQKNEEYMAKARKYEWNSGLGLSKASSSMFEEDAPDRVPTTRAGVVSDAEVEDVDDESEVSNSQIDAGLLDEDGEPRRRARSWSTGSHISVYRQPTPEEEPDVGGMQQDSPSPTPRRGQTQMISGSPSSSRFAASPFEDEDMMYQTISPDFTPAEAPKPRKLNLGTGLRRKSTSDAQADLPLFRSRTPPAADLGDDVFGGSPREMSPLHPQEDPRAATLEELQLEEMSNASRASSEESNPLFVRETTPWIPPRERAKAHKAKGPSKQRRSSPASAARSSSGLPHTTQKHSRVNADANLAQQPSLQAKAVVAPSISRKTSSLTCAPASLSAPPPAEVSSPTINDFDLPFGNSSWNFDAIDAVQAEAEAHTSDQTPLALRAKTQTKHRTATPDSNTSAKTLKQKPQRQLKPKKSVRFADDPDADGLLYPTVGGKSFQLIGQQAKGPLLPTPEQAKGDWTYFKKMPSKLKRKAGDTEEEAKLEGTLGAYNRKKTKVVEPKKKSSSVIEAGDVDDSEPDQEGASEPANMRGSSPKAGKKQAGKKTKGVSTNENARPEEKSKKPAAKSNKKEPAKPKETLEEMLKKAIMNGPKTSGKRGTSGFFGPEQ
ncbi:hypothetical protein HII31_05397 [Pseudocercospora fuligena]|uniref:Uncharacterized protein n=1 Tax=Pseudocercospora fuligena TaxID=685502 RepID=A0A8H6VI58_9PEZI|nr:hypothetical protein HII31_05397 [Pseudocercospora fuligena]